MLDARRPQCAICGYSITPSEPVLDYTPFGIGYAHAGFCEAEARERAYETFAEIHGLAPVDGQCLHGVGEAWTYEQFELHVYWGCPLAGRVEYGVFDHRRMWEVQEGSLWSPITEPGLKIVTCDPYLPEAKPIPADSWLWHELGYRLQMHTFDKLAIHRPATDGSPRTALHVFTRPGVGDTEDRRERRNPL